MMVVDSSAVIAILQAEDDAQALADAMTTADQLVMSAVNAHETAMILRARGGAENADDFWQFLSVNAVEVAPFDENQARAAAEAFGLYGKGIHSKARLTWPIARLMPSPRACRPRCCSRATTSRTRTLKKMGRWLSSNAARSGNAALVLMHRQRVGPTPGSR